MTYRKAKSIDELLKRLEDKKSVKITDKVSARKFLQDNNYYTVVACGKVKFAVGMNDKKFEYRETDFDEWVEYLSKDREVSEYLKTMLIRIERILNSRLSHYLSEELESTSFTPAQKGALKQKIKSARKCKGYLGYESWKYIPTMTFGEMKKLLFWLNVHDKEGYQEITNGFDFIQTKNPMRNKNRIDELNHLRNNLVHFRPLNIYLTYGESDKTRLQNRDRKTIIRAVLSVYYSFEVWRIIEDICVNSDKFIKIKNSQPKVD